MEDCVPYPVHEVPGRIRLKLAAIKRNEARAGAAERQLRKVHGVRDACANPLTGSVVVRFDPGVVSADHIYGALQAHGFLEYKAVPALRATVAPARTLSTGYGPIADTIAKKALDALVERCAFALVAALI